MADQALKDKIYGVLTHGPFDPSRDLVDVSDGPAGDIHVLVISRKWDGMRMRDRREMIWKELDRALEPDEWGQISLTMGVSPEQAKAVG